MRAFGIFALLSQHVLVAMALPPCEGPSMVPCAGGCWNAAGTVQASVRQCVAVGVGYYSPPGDDSRYTCAAGQYSDTVDAAQCLRCSAGRYASDTGASACDYCPPGTYTELSSSSSCQTCDPTYYDGPGSDYAVSVPSSTGPGVFCLAPKFPVVIQPTSAPTPVATTIVAKVQGSVEPTMVPTDRPTTSLTPTVAPTTRAETAKPTTMPSRRSLLPTKAPVGTDHPTTLSPTKPKLWRLPRQSTHAPSTMAPTAASEVSTRTTIVRLCQRYGPLLGGVIAMAAVALLYQYIRMPKPKKKKQFGIPPPPPLPSHGSETVAESCEDDKEAAASSAAECDQDSVRESSTTANGRDDELDRLERAVTRGESHGLQASIE